MDRDIGHPRQRPDNEPVVLQPDGAKRQRIDVDQPLGVLDFLPHEIDECRSASDVPAARGGARDRRLLVVHPHIGKRVHRQWVEEPAGKAATELARDREFAHAISRAA